MIRTANDILSDMFSKYPKLQQCRSAIENALMLLINCYDKGGKVLVCGNGGSAADSEHIVGELMKGFILKRPIKKDDIDKIKEAFPDDWKYLSENLQCALPAISLVSQTAISSAFTNDIAADMVYAQQVFGYGKRSDALIGLSTSGNSKNVVNAVKIAKIMGMKTIGMTGKDGGILKEICDVVIQVPETETYKVQEYHLPIYHALCAELEMEFFKGGI